MSRLSHLSLLRRSSAADTSTWWRRHRRRREDEEVDGAEPGRWLRGAVGQPDRPQAADFAAADRHLCRRLAGLPLEATMEHHARRRMKGRVVGARAEAANGGGERGRGRCLVRRAGRGEPPLGRQGRSRAAEEAADGPINSGRSPVAIRVKKVPSLRASLR